APRAVPRPVLGRTDHVHGTAGPPPPAHAPLPVPDRRRGARALAAGDAPRPRGDPARGAPGPGAPRGGGAPDAGLLRDRGRPHGQPGRLTGRGPAGSLPSRPGGREEREGEGEGHPSTGPHHHRGWEDPRTASPVGEEGWMGGRRRTWPEPRCT